MQHDAHVLDYYLMAARLRMTGERLGEPFETIWDLNIDKLYER